MRHTLAVVLFAATAATASAQQGMKPDADPDTKARSSGPAPAGWEFALDRATAKKEDVAFSAMGKGMHVTSGPAAIFWSAGNVARGPYAIKATFTQMKASTHPEAYGLVFGGEKLGTADATYLYFIVRQDGKFMVKHRANATAVHTITDWSESKAVAKVEGAGKATNALEVRADADSVRLFVNNQQVAAYSAKVMNETDGIYGIRVNHNLDVHVEGFGRN